MISLPDTCPPLDDLLAATPNPGVQAHAETCPRCGTLRATAGSLHPGAPTGVDPARFALSDDDDDGDVAPADIGVGTIARIGAGELEEALLALVTGLTASLADVIPVRDEVACGTDYDVLLDTNLLGYAALAQTWNAGTVLREQLRDALVDLEPEDWRAVDAVYGAARSGGTPPAGAPVGPPVESQDDVRLSWVAREWDVAQQYYAIAGTFDDDLAGVLRAQAERRSNVGRSLDDLLHHALRDTGAAAGPEGLQAALHGAGPVEQLFDERRFGDMLVDLGLESTRRLEEVLAGCTLAAPACPPAAEPVSAGRGRAFAMRPTRASASAPSQDRLAWAQAVVARMREQRATQAPASP